MTLATFVLVAGICFFVVFALSTFTQSRRRLPRHATVIVQTRDRQSLRGLLLAEHADRLTLTEAFAVDGATEIPIAGLAHIPRANVAWVQELPQQPSPTSPKVDD